MSTIISGPLPALIGYYTRLSADPATEVAEYGFSTAKIHFALVLEPDGTVFTLDDVRARSKKGTPVPNPMLVPNQGGRSGTGVKPFFCWDNTGYVLGRDNKGNPERSVKMFEAFRRLHIAMRDNVGDDDAYAALCRFLERWDPDDAVSLPGWEDAAGKNVVVRLRGSEGYLHQSDNVRAAWLTRIAVEDETEPIQEAVSLLSGQGERIARLHPMISGVDGTNTTGAAIVSFNLDAFESYGKTQSYNAPVGILDAFRYTTALNRLLADSSRRVRIGDATVVFWTDRSEATDAEDYFAALFGEVEVKSEHAESGRTVDRLRAFLRAANQGRLIDHLHDPDAAFYIMGLSPNASRITLRFWMAGTVAQFAARLAEHAAQLKMIGKSENDPPLVLRLLLDETVPANGGWPDRRKISPLLGGELARAVFARQPYPRTLFTAVLRRIRAEGFVSANTNAHGYRKDWKAAAHRRAAILKAYLIRNYNWEVPVALEKDHADEAYQLGRLFAALEKTQEDASGGTLNATIKDRYFGAASATPASVFPRLLRLHQHHIDKIENKGWRVHREKLIGEICGHITRFPLHLSLEKQGLFHIAYYHQRQDFFQKTDDASKETSDE